MGKKSRTLLIIIFNTPKKPPYTNIYSLYKSAKNPAMLAHARLKNRSLKWHYNTKKNIYSLLMSHNIKYYEIYRIKTNLLSINIT
jgi:hypothetical protein